MERQFRRKGIIITRASGYLKRDEDQSPRV
jgi:hypothetical protein